MKKILVVDDDPVTQKLVSGLVVRRGFEVVTAGDGIDAMLMARKESPDLILLDVMLPHLNGYDICQKMKKDPALKNIPVILLTSRGQEIAPSLMQLMGIDYLHKSAGAADLQKKIDKALGLNGGCHGQDTGCG